MNILKNTKINLVILLIIVLLSVFLRFKNLSGLQHFTYDQARDALFIKRIIVDHKLRLIGTQSSIPGLYTPPMYYYLMTPFLFVFNLNPVGIDYATAFFGMLTVVLLYYLLTKLTEDRLLALSLTSLYGFQPSIIYQSRYAWNPNTVPFFVMLAMVSLLKILKGTKGFRYYGLLFFCLGLIINLHYSGVVFFVSILFLLLFFFKRLNKKYFFGGIAIFCLELFPLILFDLRHNFVNTKGIINYFLYNPRNDLPAPPFFVGVFDKYKFLLNLVFPINFNSTIGLIFLSVFTLFFISWLFKSKNEKFKVLGFLFLSSIALASLYKRGFFAFYLTFLYPLPFLIIGSLFSRTKQKRVKRLFMYIFIFLCFVWSLKNFQTSFVQVENNRIGLGEKLRKNSLFVAEKVAFPFNIASISSDPERFGFNAVDYRYFLETFYKKQALDWDPIDYQKAPSLYFISEVGEVSFSQMADIWEVKVFQPSKIAEKWQKDDIILYKLVK